MTSQQTQEVFGSLIGHISRLWRRRVDERLEPFGLTEATWLPLFYLSRAKTAMRQKELAAALQLDSSSVVRGLDALQTAGLVERREEAGDRRANSLILTLSGQDMAAKIETVVRQVRSELLSSLPEPDLDAAMRVLQAVYVNLLDPKNETLP